MQSLWMPIQADWESESFDFEYLLAPDPESRSNTFEMK